MSYFLFLYLLVFLSSFFSFNFSLNFFAKFSGCSSDLIQQMASHKKSYITGVSSLTE